MAQKIGKYEVIEELGRGAMGVVYKGKDPFIGRFVALKTITTGLQDQPELLQRFYREAQAAGGLQHPNVVTVYDLGEAQDGTPYIAMEFLEGEDLEKYIAEQRTIPLSQKINYMVQVARALDYAHKRGVVHRDIKPANIVVTKEGVPKVLDFGIARLVDTSRSQTGLLIGTVNYMSPEQVRGERVDARSDVFSLGVLFYELVCWQRPFLGSNFTAVMLAIISQEPKVLHELAPDCPKDLSDVVHKLLRKDVGERYQSLDEFLIDVDPIWKRLQRESVSDLVAQGEKLMKQKDFDRARDLLRQAVLIDTSHTQAKSLLEKVTNEMRRSMALPEIESHLAKAQSLIKEGGLEEASQEAEAAVKLDSMYAPAQDLLKKVQEEAGRQKTLKQLLRTTRQRLAEGSLTEAENSLNQVLQIESGKEAQELKRQLEEEKARRETRKRLLDSMQQARNLWTQQKYDDCIAILTQLQKEFPSEADVAKLLETVREDQAEQQKHQKLAEAKSLLAGQRFADALGVLEPVWQRYQGDPAVCKLYDHIQAERKVHAQRVRLEREQAALRKLVNEEQWAAAVSQGEALAKEFPDEVELARMVDFARSQQALAEHQRKLKEKSAVQEKRAPADAVLTGKDAPADSTVAGQYVFASPVQPAEPAAQPSATVTMQPSAVPTPPPAPPAAPPKPEVKPEAKPPVQEEPGKKARPAAPAVPEKPKEKKQAVAPAPVVERPAVKPAARVQPSVTEPRSAPLPLEEPRKSPAVRYAGIAAAVVLVGVIGWFALRGGGGFSGPTADQQQLYDQAQQLFTQGDKEAALAKYKEYVAFAIAGDEKTAAEGRITEIEQGFQAEQSAWDAAKTAQDSKDWNTADAKYQEVIAIGGKRKPEAEAALETVAALQRGEDLATIERNKFAQANGAFRRGNYARAQSLFAEVVGMNGANLSAAQQQLQLIEARLNEERVFREGMDLRAGQNGQAVAKFEEVARMNGSKKADAQTQINVIRNATAAAAALQKYNSEAQAALGQKNFRQVRSLIQQIQSVGGDARDITSRLHVAEKTEFDALANRFNQLRSRDDDTGLRSLQREAQALADGGGSQADAARTLAANQIPAAITTITRKKEEASRTAAPSEEAEDKRKFDEAVSAFNSSTRDSAALRGNVTNLFRAIASSDSKYKTQAQDYLATLIPAAIGSARSCPPIDVPAGSGKYLQTYKAGELVPANRLDEKPAWVAPCAAAQLKAAALLSVTIDENGNVTDVRPRAPSPDFDAAAAAVKTWKAAPPPKFKGQPVKTTVSVDLRPLS